MGQRGNIMSFRPDIKVLDATLRDGGLVNSFQFSDEFVKDLYAANVKAGVDYMEFGYKADRGMAEGGRTNYKRDIPEKANSPVDLYRIATYINTMPAAIEMVEYCHKQGYETTVNIMAISSAKERDIDTALYMLGESCVDGIYIVDSYGSIYPEEMREIADKYMELGEQYHKYIGVHSHNNQQLAFANTIEAISRGVSYADATVNSMGRGAGNCPLELLLGFLRNPKYNINSILQFIERHMLPLRATGVKWGYDIPYMLTGQLNRHPRSAIEYTAQGRTDYLDFYQSLMDRE